MKIITIGNYKIGPQEPTFIIAEAGVNHNGDLDLAKQHIKEARYAGANAIKFQTYTAGKLVTKDAPIYWHVGNDTGKSQYEVFSKIDYFPLDFYKEALAYANDLGIVLFSTPFDLEAVDDLEEIGIPAYKIASADITYHGLLKKVALTGKPIILSTGAATIGEIEDAVNVIKNTGNDQIILLHCILAYPTAQEDIHLKMIPSLARIFPDIPIGLSDHTFSPLTPALATMLGCKVVEKHFTVDKSLPGSSDHKMGVNPYELKLLSEAVRLAEISSGQEYKSPVNSEVESLQLARRSVVSTVEIKKGTVITAKMLTCKRPGTGISPKLLDAVVGRTATKNIPADTVITWDML